MACGSPRGDRDRRRTTRGCRPGSSRSAASAATWDRSRRSAAGRPSATRGRPWRSPLARRRPAGRSKPATSAATMRAHVMTGDYVSSLACRDPVARRPLFIRREDLLDNPGDCRERPGRCSAGPRAAGRRRSGSRRRAGPATPPPPTSASARSSVRVSASRTILDSSTRCTAIFNSKSAPRLPARMPRRSITTTSARSASAVTAACQTAGSQCTSLRGKRPSSAAWCGNLASRSSTSSTLWRKCRCTVPSNMLSRTGPLTVRTARSPPTTRSSVPMRRQELSSASSRCDRRRPSLNGRSSSKRPGTRVAARRRRRRRSGSSVTPNATKGQHTPLPGDCDLCIEAGTMPAQAIRSA